MRSAQFRAIVEPILNEEFDGIYSLRKDEWKGIFTESDGIKRQYHEEPVLFGFGAAPEIREGAPVTYDSGGVLFIKRYFYSVYGLAFSLTRVLVEDGDHIRIGRIYARHLANALIETKETLTANVLNRSFNGSFPGGDGVALVANNHPIVGGTFSNVLATPAALSQTSLEQMLIQIRQSAVDNNGKKIKLTPKKLIVHANNMFQAEVILNTILRPGTANNDINPIKSQAMLPGGQHVVSRLTSATAWWVQTDAPEGLKILMRRRVDNSMEGDFETDSMRYKATERYAVGWTDPRCLYGTAGL
jgi:hypothetical protein